MSAAPLRHSATPAAPAGGPRHASIACGIPVFNPDERLARAVRSVASQSLPPAAVHVRDDASSNGFDIASLAALVPDERWQVQRNAGNRGMFDNFLQVLLEAKGEFFAFLAQDDQWRPAYLEKLHAALASHPRAVVAFSSNEHVVDGAVVDAYAAPPRGVVEHRSLALLAEFFRGNSRLNNAIYYGLWRRDVLVDVMRHIEARGLKPNEKLPVMLGILAGPAVSVPEVLFVKDHGRRKDSRGPGGEVGPMAYIGVLLPQLVTGISCVATFPRAGVGLKAAATVGQLWMFARKVAYRLRRAVLP